MSRIKNFLKGVRDKILWHKRKKYLPAIEKLIPESTSVFSMNCFAGRIYQDLGREYNTPTAGLFFTPQDFVKIGQDISVIKREIEEITESKWRGAKEVVKNHGKYPIGKIKGTDIEIHFLHYPTFEEAIDKWKRRVERFNFDDYFFIAFCQNGWEEYPDLIYDFSTLPVERKILFTNDSSNNKQKGIVGIKNFRNYKDSPDPYKKAHIYYQYLIKE